MKNLITRDGKKDIEVARKYKLRLFTFKLAVFRLFDASYSPAEARYILRDFEIPGEHRTFRNAIRWYHSIWKKAQTPKAQGK